MKKVIIFCLVMLFSSIYINGTEPSPFVIKPLFIDIFEKHEYTVVYVPDLVELQLLKDLDVSDDEADKVDIDSEKRKEETRKLLRKNNEPVAMIMISDLSEIERNESDDSPAETKIVISASFFECNNAREAKKWFDKKLKDKKMVFINKNIVMEIEKDNTYDSNELKKEIDKIVDIFKGIK